MNRNVMIVLAGGFLIAILVAVLVQGSLSGSKKKEVAAVATTQILTAARDLPSGQELVAGDTKWQEWPEGAVFAGAIRREGEQVAEEAASGRLRQAVAAGQPILLSGLVKGEQGNFLAGTLKEGMRAIGISVKAQTMVGGFIAPGDSVDVIVTYQVQIDDRDNPAISAMVSRHASETVLENVRVLAVDQEAMREEDAAKIARTVTLEVDAQGAEKLSLAEEMGEVTLALRGIGDKGLRETETMTTDVQMSRVLKSLSKIQGGSGPSGMVRVYNGSEATNMPVRQAIE